MGERERERESVREGMVGGEKFMIKSLGFLTLLYEMGLKIMIFKTSKKLR
jgi:hypothetical protein